MYKKVFNIEKFSFNIDDVLKIAWEAGKEIMNIYQKDFSVEYKDDKSPLTEADKKSHEIIAEGLKKYNLPVLSEEGKNIPYEERKDWEYFWMIDPIDGTKEFIKKNGEFTINIALIHKNKPIFGVVYAPVLDWIYFRKRYTNITSHRNKR
nr:3'(2'),5'-bisphosphate nucleotidase CysQ [Lebetimonas sp. JH292]